MKENKNNNMDYIKSPQFIVEFLKTIEQPLQEEQVNAIEKLIMKETIQRHRKAFRKVILG
jgi:hypothetical protein